jgi:hypothetical protein
VRLKVFPLALGVCLVYCSAAAQQAPVSAAIGIWQGSVSGDFYHIIPYVESVFTPNVPIVITRIEALVIRYSKGGQVRRNECSTAAAKLHDDAEQTHASLTLLPDIEHATIYKGVYAADSGEMAVLIPAKTRLWMSLSVDRECQIQDVKVIVQYQTSAQ